jgi:hypothetical protein
MVSPARLDAQFQLRGEHPANLDRCRRCGCPRLLHAADGACGLSFPKHAPRAALAITAAGVLTAIGIATWLLVTTTTANVSSAAAFAALVSLILLVGLAAVAERKR